MYVSLWKRAALCLACFGMIIPQGALVAAEKPQQQASARMLDVSLTEGGTFSGRIVDTQGRAVKGAKVAVRFQNHIVAQATTNEAGRYAVSGLMGGVHQLETVNGRVSARFWNAKTAPPAAKPVALIVSDKNVIRAQCGEVGCGAGVGTVVGNGCGVGGGWIAGNAYHHHGGYYNGGYADGCYDYGYAPGGGFAGGHGGLLLGGLVVAGVITAIAIAADDDGGRRRSSP